MADQRQASSSQPSSDGAAQPPDSATPNTGIPIALSGHSGKYIDPASKGAIDGGAYASNVR
ncbi:hypothetical protein [Undibacterium sp. Ren11W]|uniref:hypothetical protein n=1 Tax=Undibacterium sp. Ren11W TaxID=3413045 RepID=UPI003BF30EE6